MTDPRGPQAPNVSNRFQPSMSSAQQKWQSQADDAAAYAQVIALQEKARDNVVLLNRYTEAAGENLETGRDLGAAVFGMLQEFVRKLSTVTGMASNMTVGIPYPQAPTDPSPYHAQFTYDGGMIQAKISDAQSRADALLAGTDVEAAKILDAAYNATAPSRPMGLSEKQVDDIKSDIRAALAENAGTRIQTANNILAMAMADNDQAVLFCLLGQPCKLLLTSQSIDRVKLLAKYADARVQAIDYAANPHPLTGIVGGRFLQLQTTDQALAKLPALARAYFQARQRDLSDLLNSTMVQQNLR